MDTKSVFYLIQLFEGLGMGSFFPIYTPWLEAHGLNFFKMGTVNFFYHISASTLDPFTGFIADKFGKRKTFISGQILWTAMLYIYGASTQIVGFILAEGIAAVGGSLKSDTLESWLQNKLGKLEASRVMGRAKILFTIGQIIASIASGYLSATLGMKLMWFISGTCMLTATILSSITLAKAGGDVSTNTTERNNIADVNIKKIFTLTATNRKIVSTALIVAAFSFASKPVFMYWPQIVSRLGMADTLRGWVILSVAIPAMIGGLLAGHGVFFTHNKAGLIRILLLLSVGMLTSAFTQGLNLFLVGLTITETAYGALGIFTYSYLFDEVKDTHRTTVSSILSATKTLGGAASLLTLGEVADRFSPQVSFAVGGLAVLLVILFYAKLKA